jgi:hypothetical protein
LEDLNLQKSEKNPKNPKIFSGKNPKNPKKSKNPNPKKFKRFFEDLKSVHHLYLGVDNTS